MRPDLPPPAQRRRARRRPALVRRVRLVAGRQRLLVQAAKAAIAAEGLGKDDVPDLLSVSFSATDLIYHHFGPYSWEMQDALVRLDRQIADLLAAAEKAAGGRQNLLVVLSSDHGGAALPEELDRRRARTPRG